MIWVIFDSNSETYFARHTTSTRGWYSEDIMDARSYKTEEQARKVIRADGHHVSYPGNRLLKPMKFNLG